MTNATGFSYNISISHSAMNFSLLFRRLLPMLSLCAALAGSCTTLHAGRDPILDPALPTHWYLGVFGGVNLNSHSGNYTIYDGDNPCCTFTSGSGTGLAAGLRAYIPLSDPLWLCPRLSYEVRGGMLSSNEYTQLVRGKNNQPELGTFRYELEAGLPFVNLDALAAWSILPDMGAYVCAGPSIAVAVNASFTEYDNILSPSGVSFDSTGQTRKLMNEGKLAGYNSVQFGLRLGAGANIHIWKKWYLSPEVLFHLPVTSYSTDRGASWKGSLIQCTLGLTRQL